MKLIFLGTTCMMPTKERNHYSVYLERFGEGILFDCGEGTQRQMKIAGVKPTKITKIFISHWHGDHVLGLPGLMQTMAASEFNSTLHIYGPKGTKKKINAMFEAFVFDNKLDLEVHDIKEGEKIIDNSEYLVETHKLDHSIETFGYRFAEKDKLKINEGKLKLAGIPNGPLLSDLQDGKDIEYKGKKYLCKDLTYAKKGKILGVISDTKVTDNCYVIAKDADLLISEASYSHKQKNKADEYFHLTSKQAAEIASASGAQRLILTHFSQRYKTVDDIQDEAQEIFEKVECAYDLMKTEF